MAQRPAIRFSLALDLNMANAVERWARDQIDLINPKTSDINWNEACRRLIGRALYKDGIQSLPPPSNHKPQRRTEFLEQIDEPDEVATTWEPVKSTAFDPWEQPAAQAQPVEPKPRRQTAHTLAQAQRLTPERPPQTPIDSMAPVQPIDRPNRPNSRPPLPSESVPGDYDPTADSGTMRTRTHRDTDVTDMERELESFGVDLNRPKF